MNNYKYKKVCVLLFTALITSVQGSDIKLAQTGFQFLSVSSDARAGAMGDAMTTLFTQSSSLFFNPAGMSRQDNFINASLSQNHWIADIKHNAISVSVAPMNGKFGIFGMSFLHVDYGEMQGTMVWDNAQGFIDTEIFSPSAMALGIGYAKSLSNKFSVGGQIKTASQYLGKNVVPETDTSQTVVKNVTDALAFDFGTIYQTGWKSFAFGMSVRNFSQEIKFQTEGFQLPLTFAIGASMDVLDFFPSKPTAQQLVLSIDALHPRSYSERLNIGLEYRLLNLLNVRAGYLVNYDEQDFTAGIGIQKHLGPIYIGVDYAYTPFGVFDDVQRLTLNISLN
ncbi:MAG TPA: PorV/PorQ family protein [Candidatus Marinimicrobia bacterium]|jgi:hypothetical protein|nr:PorV/PorQ family protein [Candidatus Neomarinimicrobiota bacterium]MDP7566247.1 PorV/PorQ family protein [Candidatus Neomarinimicrobiota bacterium]HJL75464.1 PorV/PorQ family protein [Candidatus Neomarinimicrobiota bacterium]HJM70123.1 PorV/PorQ family protein [Candidatus Neomarinimicrobiota bacterium]|tara:strand:+ start:17124 stop:18134 length:1011 start_codon:yes stop_codon:yes gene_type:complete